MKDRLFNFLKSVCIFSRRSKENKIFCSFSEFLDTLNKFEDEGHKFDPRIYKCKRCGLSFEDYKNGIKSNKEKLCNIY